MKYIIVAFCSILFFQAYSCLEPNSPDLSGSYWLMMRSKAITSRVRPQYNSIYPVVTDYAYNEDFIIVEQQPDRDKFLLFLESDLFGRFKNYTLYKKDPNLLYDSFYSALKGFVEKDSVLYKQFLHEGATNDESVNHTISTRMAENLIKHDNYYKKILSSSVNYWIIYHPSQTLIGPLTKQEYLVKKAEIGVPDIIKLKFEK